MNNMNDYLSQLIAMITGSGSAMAQPGAVDQIYSSGDPRNFAPNQGSVDGGMMDVVNQMNQMPEEGYLKDMPLPNNVIDGAFHTPEQLIEQKMQNSGNTPMPQGFDIEKVREMIRSQKMR